MNLPIIRFEIEGIRQTMLVALTAHQAAMDTSLKAAVEEYCQPDNIERIIQSAAREALTTAIKAEVQNFFWKGEGRSAVAEAVKSALLNRETYTPLDDVPTP